MLLDFLREIERKQRQDEISQAAEESKTITLSTSNEHRKEVVPDVKAAQEELCGVCGQNGHKYKCPRCGVLYCGIACFQSHKSGQCNEEFAKDCVEEELKAQKSSVKQRNEMNRMLLKDFRGENSEEEETKGESGISVERLEQLLKRVQLDPSEDNKQTAAKDICPDLTEEEKRDFDTFVQSQASKHVEVWQPWWTYRV